MPKRLLGILLGAWMMICAANVSAEVTLAVNYLGLYDSPMKPLGKASALTDGFGFFFMPEAQFGRIFGLGFGFTSEYLYGKDGQALRVGTVDFASRLRLPSSGLKAQPYFITDLGFNNLSNTGNHWQGSTRLAIGVGTRLPVALGLALDLGVRQVWLFPKPNDLQYLSVEWGLVSEFSFVHHAKKDAPKPTPRPKPAASTTPKVVTSVTPSASPTATATFVPQAVPPTPTPSPLPTMVPSKPAPAMAPAAAKAFMLDSYEKGIEAYKEKRFATAVVYLKKAVGIQDKSIESFYYAEAYAMLGVIYQYHRTDPGHLGTARQYYRAAIKIDPQTATAKKGLKILGPGTTRHKPKTE